MFCERWSGIKRIKEGMTYEKQYHKKINEQNKFKQVRKQEPNMKKTQQDLFVIWEKTLKSF